MDDLEGNPQIQSLFKGKDLINVEANEEEAKNNIYAIRVRPFRSTPRCNICEQA